MTPAFRRVGRLAKGYDVDRVDDLFRLAGGRAGTAAAGPAPDRPGRTPDRPGRTPDRPGRTERARLTTDARRFGLAAGQLRLAAFPLRRRGYDVAQVDEALDRLEDRAAADERDRLVGERGDEALLQQLGSLAATLDSRLARPPGRRFRRGVRLHRAYDPADVDALCDLVAAYLSDGAPMSVDEVRGAVFRSRRGRRGYREADVDAFLDRVVTIMLAVD